MGRRFDAPTAPPVDRQAASDTDLWDRLERGDDPTV
jgi:hypothetical protein